jgi:hypothetical protein
MRLRAPATCLFIAAPILLACSATNKPVEADWSDAPEEKSRPVRDSETLATPMPEEREPASAGSSAPIGVRHDLMLSNRPHSARCACLAVEVGPATDPNFFWAGGAPPLGSDAVAFAIGARGVDCPGGSPDESRRRPSISAVDQENNDLIIEIEDLPEGRPLASGAIIPRPGAGGAIYVRPRAPGQVYARGQPGGRCKVR